MKMVSFVFVQHFDLACGAALLFLVGVLLAIPVGRHGSTLFTWLPLMLFRMVGGLLGSRPSMTRLWFVIFGFNGTAMALYMASGVHPAVPATICLVTGYNIAVILLLVGERKDLDDLAISPAGAWMPARWVAGLCGLAVILLELPCFWYSIAMGIRLGQEITADQTSYMQGIVTRLHAYALLLLPILLVSAVCEAIAIRGMSASPPPQPQGSGVGGQGSGHPPEPQHLAGGGVGS
jgi:hypothetical protein